MGGLVPVADFGAATPAGQITIDGHDLQLWHGSMHSHSDLSDSPRGPLATLLGMPPKSTWPDGIHAFQTGATGFIGSYPGRLMHRRFRGNAAMIAA